VFAAGCQWLVGLHDTKLEPTDAAPDAAPIDLGTGGDGELLVSGVTTTDDIRTALTVEVGANSTLLDDEYPSK
jgi:hypothetical protein